MRLTHPVTGHTVSTDDASASFWESAGYRAEKPAKAAAKAAPKKASKSK